MIRALTLVAVILAALSGAPSAIGGRSSDRGQRMSALLSVLASIAGVAAAVLGLGAPETEIFALGLPAFSGVSAFAIDPLSAAFLLPIFLVSGLGAIYGLGYWAQTDHPTDGRKLRVFYGALTASLALVVTARNGVAFLFAWEAMAIAAFFLATTEDGEKPVREAGWAYLIATHIGTLSLFAVVVLLDVRFGSFVWARGAGSPRPWLDGAIFVLTIGGFGFKAGIVPFHFWLPAAHANAPSHVSAMMSAVMLKAGIYGVLRVTWLFAVTPEWWGTTLMVIGAGSALFGIFIAGAQGDIKRLLAYSSIENVGIMFVGVGLALFGRARSRPELVALGLAGCVLHVWNHSLFKSLLFFVSGSVIHAMGTREMDRMGGLAKRMPWTAAACTVGAASVSGLPPLNGFSGEWLLYLGLFAVWSDVSRALSVAAVVIVALALTGALAVACFVKLVGIVFLGAPRSEAAAHAHEADRTLLGPMLALAFLCWASATASPWIVPALEPVASAWLGHPLGVSVLRDAPMGWISALGVALALLVLGIAGALRSRLSRATSTGTWDCGFALPTARMQYTGRSFSEWLAEKGSPAIQRAEERATGLFPAKASFATTVSEPFQSRVYGPFLEYCAVRFTRLRALQRGRLNVYIVYVVVTLLALFVWAAIGSRVGA